MIEHAPDRRKLSFAEKLGNCVAFSIGKAYWALFGWSIDAPVSRKRQRRFASEIRRRLAFLFEEHGAEIIPNEGVPFPEPFDYATVTVAVGALLLRFVRGRGEFRVLVISKSGPRDWRDWKDLLLVRKILDESEDRDSERMWIRDLPEAAHLLKVELPCLMEIMSNGQWELVKRKANALYPPLVRIR